MKHTNQDLSAIVGANLKRYIKASKWKTQEKFAEEFGAEVRTVGRWCNRGIDKLSLIQQIADFLDIDVLALLSDREECVFFRTFFVVYKVCNSCYNKFTKARKENKNVLQSISF